MTYFTLQLCDIKKNEYVIRHFADTEPSCKLLVQKWKALKELVVVLKIPYDATIEFQNQKLTLTDVYGKWIGMQLHLKLCMTKKQFKSELPRHLYDCFEKRKEIIFKNSYMLGALYLDPRYRAAITSNYQQSEEARKILCKVWRRIHLLKSTHDQSIMEKSVISSDSFDIEFDEQKAVLQHLNQGAADEEVKSTDDIETIIDLFQPNPIPINSSVLEYWDSVKNTESQLFELAMVIFSVPPTEVQIERDFSSLKFIFTERRCRLTQSRLESILLIHLNKDLFYEVNKEQLNEIRNENTVTKSFGLAKQMHFEK